MCLKNSWKALKSILARSAIFASFAVTTGAGSARALKDVRARRLPRNKCPTYFPNLFLKPDIRFELFEFFFKKGLLRFKDHGGLFKFFKKVVDG